MEPIERLAIAAEKHLAKCEELEPLHTNFLICQMNHIDSLRDPKSRTAELRERWDRAFFAALTGACAKPVHVWPDGSWDHYDPVGTAEGIANETIRHHAELMASRDAAIAEVAG